MEGDGAVDPRPELGMAAPLGEVAPTGGAAVEHPLAHVAGIGLGAGRAEHLPDDHGVLAVLVPAVDGGDLVVHIHRDGEGHGRGLGGGLGGMLGQHNGGIVEDQVPGQLAHHAVGLQGVLGLEGLHRRGGLGQEVAADGASIVPKLRQAGLQLLHQRAGGAPGQLLAEGHGGVGGSSHIPLGIVNDQEGIRRGGGNDLRLDLLAQRVAAVEKALRVIVGHAGFLQAVLLLKGGNAALRPLQIVAADLAVIIAQLGQAGLEALHVLAGGAVAQRPVQHGEEQRLGLGVGHTGHVQVEILLEGTDSRPGSLPVAAGNIPCIIVEIRQPLLQFGHVVAIIAVLHFAALHGLFHHHVLAGENHLALAQRHGAGQQQQDSQQNTQAFHSVTSSVHIDP